MPRVILTLHPPLNLTVHEVVQVSRLTTETARISGAGRPAVLIAKSATNRTTVIAAPPAPDLLAVVGPVADRAVVFGAMLATATMTTVLCGLVVSQLSTGLALVDVIAAADVAHMVLRRMIVLAAERALRNVVLRQVSVAFAGIARQRALMEMLVLA